jgi:PAS domain S-box-containing protein
MSIIDGLKFAIHRLPARARIAIGQVLLLASVLLLAVALGIVPNERRAVLAGRSKLCEAVAVECSSRLQRNETAALRGTFESMLRRDGDVLSAGLHRADGTMVACFGDASDHGSLRAGSDAGSALAVPIWSGERKWGWLKIRFRPVSRGGLLGWIAQPQLRLIGFVCGLCLILYLIYLRKMLRHLDPSSAIPPRVRAAFDTLAEGVVVLDASQRIVLANQALAEIVGRSPEQLMGIAISELEWADPVSQSSPWAVASGGGISRGVVMRMRDAQGAVCTFSVNCSPVLGDNGERRGVLMSLDDVTQLERNEAELRRSKREADAANRAKSDFLARMSHEIRTPMNAILGFADLLRRGYEQDEAERQEYVETIHSSGQHLLELINDILDLSKIEAGKLGVETCRCSPRKLINEVISVMSVRAAQKAITLEADWNGDAPETIETDPTRLRQALTNLVGNAIKFTEAGGVRVAARLMGDGLRPKLAIDVADTGIGMKPEVLGRIFEPFAQGDTSITRRFGGTGLGLSISKQIAEALGGDIAVASEPGRGSTFTLTVDAGSPAGVSISSSGAEPQAFPSDSMGAQAAIRLDGIRILLAEDGASNRKLISLVLGRAGAILETAEDGRAAVEMALAGDYALVLLDMQMPVMDGYSAAMAIRKHGLTIPIIALTAHAMRGDEEKCRAAGCSGFLAKPIDMDLLLRTIAATLGGELLPRVPRDLSRLNSTLPMADPEFRQIVEEFIERLRSQIEAMVAAWSTGDLDQLAALAHWIKGSGGTAGFDVLTEPARLLERAVRENRSEEIAAAISELQALGSRIEFPGRSRSIPPLGEPIITGVAA